ncbi:MAG: sialate O-acetylesterase [Phycisphaerae bacterium]|nr:sialate O-acetylesterase [Phycisphaerae bacterium]
MTTSIRIKTIMALASMAITAFAFNSAAGAKPLKVYILAGQSNMEGKASNALLESQAANPKFQEFWAPYRKGDEWVERDDVFVTFLGRHGPLTIGYGSKGRTGPELGFGWVLGEHFEEPVLLIKAAWGGHSLYKLFRSPSAGLPSEEALKAELESAQSRAKKKKQPEPTMEKIKEGYGSSYRNMMAEVKRVLSEKDSLFPALRGSKPEIAGFFWFQGFNDQFGDQAPGAYEANMKHFINDVRKDLKAPKMPFVIAGIGTFGWDGTAKPKEGSGTAKVLNGQLAMNVVPQFKGNVKAFETAPLYDAEAAKIFPTWKKQFERWKTVGSDRPYHYLGSGIWYTRIGRTAGQAMVELLGK